MFVSLSWAACVSVQELAPATTGAGVRAVCTTAAVCTPRLVAARPAAGILIRTVASFYQSRTGGVIR